MAITFTLVAKGSNHLVYLASSSGGGGSLDTGVIQPTGAGGANVAMEDAVIPGTTDAWKAGLLKQIVDRTGVTTQAIARRQLLDWGLAPVVGDGIANVPGKRARAYIVPVLPVNPAVLKNWSIDADTNGAGRGEYNVSCTDVGVSTALVVIEAIGTPQQF